jgi:pimeloyl-ACP methyl ester carboxylesterase
VLTNGNYRYGLSEGKPNEKGIRMDAQTALDYIRSHPVLEKTKVVLYGQSIGGAVAVDLASNNPDRIEGIILENTFLSLVCGQRDLICREEAFELKLRYRAK